MVASQGIVKTIAEYGDVRKINFYSEGGGKKYELDDKKGV